MHRIVIEGVENGFILTAGEVGGIGVSGTRWVAKSVSDLQEVIGEIMEAEEKADA